MTTYMHTSKNGTLARCNAKTPDSCPLGGRHYTSEEHANLVVQNDPRALPIPALDLDQDRVLTAENKNYAESKAAWQQLNHVLGELEEADKEANNRLSAWMIEEGIPKVCSGAEIARLNDEVDERVEAISSQFDLSPEAKQSLRTQTFIEGHARSYGFNRMLKSAETTEWMNGLRRRQRGVHAELEPVVEALRSDPAIVRGREFVVGQELAKQAITGTSQKMRQFRAEERTKRKIAANAASVYELRGAGSSVWTSAERFAKWNAAGVPANAKRLTHLTQISPSDVDASGENGTFTNVWYAKGEDVSRVVSYTPPSLPGATGFFTTESGERLQGETRYANYRKSELGTKFGEEDGLFVQPVENPKSPAVDNFHVWGSRDSGG